MPKEDRGLFITLYTLVVLKDLGLHPASKQARKMIDRVDKSVSKTRRQSGKLSSPAFGKEVSRIA